MVKNQSAVLEGQIQSLGLGHSLEKEMATLSSILAWEIPWSEKPIRLQSLRSQNSQTQPGDYNVIAMAWEQEIPLVFALGRKALGRCVKKLVPISVVGIFRYFGTTTNDT